jgi:glycosyltransferase involved in cell wall biosynthesis
LRSQYEQLAQSLALHHRIHFVGSIANHELPVLYTAADVFVLPSSETESAGLVLLEALACATPVIGSDVGGIHEQFRHEREGLLVPARAPEPLSEAINWMLRHREEARLMGAAGARRIHETRGWDQIAAMLENIYEDV